MPASEPGPDLEPNWALVMEQLLYQTGTTDRLSAIGFIGTT